MLSLSFTVGDLSAYVGLPFRAGGRDRDGLDCYGLLCLVYREQIGIVLPTHSDRYTTTEDGEALAAIIAGEIGPWREVPAGAERPGDGLLMSLDGLARHIGVVAGAGRVLHIESGMGSILERYGAPRLARRVNGFFRHESLA